MNENNPLPMEILDRLRELLKDSEFEVVSYDYKVEDFITVKFAFSTRWKV